MLLLNQCLMCARALLPTFADRRVLFASTSIDTRICVYFCLFCLVLCIHLAHETNTGSVFAVYARLSSSPSLAFRLCTIARNHLYMYACAYRLADARVVFLSIKKEENVCLVLQVTLFSLNH